MDQLSASSKAFLRRFLEGTVNLEMLAEWLVAEEYDETRPPDERDMLAGVRLNVIEFMESRAADTAVREYIRSLLSPVQPRGTRQSA
jgi:hypothetical protein